MLNEFKYMVLRYCVLFLIPLSPFAIANAQSGYNPWVKNCIAEAQEHINIGSFQQSLTVLNSSFDLPDLSLLDSIGIILNICESYKGLNRDSTIHYLSILHKLSQDNSLLRNSQGIQAVKQIGEMYVSIDSFTVAATFYSDLLENIKDIEEDSTPYFIADIYKGKTISHMRLKEYNKAYECTSEALKAKMQFTDLEPGGLADNYYLHAYICNHLNYNYEAIENYKTAIKEYELQETMPYNDIALCKHNLAYTYNSIDLQDLAYKYFNDAYYNWVVESRDSSYIVPMYSNIGGVLRKLGQSEEAEFYLLKALGISIDQNRPVGSIASVYVNLARNANSDAAKLNYYFKADSILNLNDPSSKLMRIINADLGTFYYNKLPSNYATDKDEEYYRNLRQSSAYIEKAISSRKKSSQWYFFLLRNKLRDDNYDKDQVLKEIKDLIPNLEGIQNQDFLRLNYLTLGRYYKDIDQRDSASHYFNLLMSTYPDIIIDKNDIASVTNLENLPLNINTQRVLLHYLRYLKNIGDQKEFNNTEKEAIISFAKVSQLNAIRYINFSRSQQREIWDNFKECTDILLEILYEHGNPDKKDYAMLRAVNRYLSLSHLKALFSLSKDQAINSPVADSTNLMRTLQSEIFTITGIINNTTDPLERAKLDNRKMKILHRKRALEHFLLKPENGVSGEILFLPKSAEEFTATLRRNSAQYIVPYSTDSISYIITAGAQGIKAFSYDKNPDLLIDSLRQAIAIPTYQVENPQAVHDQFNRSGTEIFSTFFKEAFAELDSRIPVGYVPYGKWENLPFHLLLTAKGDNKSWRNKPYLFNTWTIYYKHGITYEKSKYKAKPLSNIRYALFGWDNFDSKIGNLKHVQEEINRVLTRTSAEVFWGNKSTVNKFLQESSKYNIVHLATHGIMTDSNSIDSYLSFYPDSIYKGRLSIGQIYHSSLPIDLIVLSACNSGISHDGALPHFSSLNNAFSHSGVKASIVALWNVSDASTAHFMEHFYDDLNKKSHPMEGVNHAYKVSLAENDILKTHPYYWGAFVYYGSPPKSSASNRDIMILLATLTISISSFVLYSVRKPKGLKV